MDKQLEFQFEEPIPPRLVADPKKSIEDILSKYVGELFSSSMKMKMEDEIKEELKYDSEISLKENGVIEIKIKGVLNE